jgi:hypothetical protein
LGTSSVKGRMRVPKPAAKTMALSGRFLDMQGPASELLNAISLQGQFSAAWQILFVQLRAKCAIKIQRGPHPNMLREQDDVSSNRGLACESSLAAPTARPDFTFGSTRSMERRQQFLADAPRTNV